MKVENKLIALMMIALSSFCYSPNGMAGSTSVKYFENTYDMMVWCYETGEFLCGPKDATSYYLSDPDGFRFDENGRPYLYRYSRISGADYYLYWDTPEYHVSTFEVTGEPSCSVADPCDPSSGKMFLHEKDYDSHATSLAFVRYYQTIGANSRDEALGENWSHNFSSYIGVPNVDSASSGNRSIQSRKFSNPERACDTGWYSIKPYAYNGAFSDADASYNEGVCTLLRGGEAVLSLPLVKTLTYNSVPVSPISVSLKSINRYDGAVINFQNIDGAGWENLSATAETLTEIKDTNDDTIEWQFRDENGTVETYDLKGHLIQIETPNGHITTLTYDAVTEKLTTVTGPFARTLVFAYTAEGRIDTLTTPDGVLHYGYDALGNLTTVQYPDNNTVTYRYEDANYPHFMTSHLDENNELHATWGYYPDGRVQFNELGDIPGGNGAERYEFVYNADGTTSVTEPLGTTQTYTFEVVNGSMRVRSIEGPAPSPCEGCVNNVNTLQSFTYNNDGTIETETDKNGNTTTYTYNSRGLETRRTITVSGTDQVILTRWHETAPLKACEIEDKRTTIYEYYTGDQDTLLRTLTQLDTSDTTLFPDMSAKECDAILARNDYASLNKRAWAYTYDANNLLHTINGPRTDLIAAGLCCFKFNIRRSPGLA